MYLIVTLEFQLVIQGKTNLVQPCTPKPDNGILYNSSKHDLKLSSVVALKFVFKHDHSFALRCHISDTEAMLNTLH
jgi:hypothetical protein